MTPSRHVAAAAPSILKLLMAGILVALLVTAALAAFFPVLSSSSPPLIIFAPWEGAGDCSSCVAVMLELARTMSQWAHGFKNSVIFIFNTGEEEGFNGAHSFITQESNASSTHLPSTCLIRNVRRKVVAIGHINREVISSNETYNIVLDNVYEPK